MSTTYHQTSFFKAHNNHSSTAAAARPLHAAADVPPRPRRRRCTLHVHAAAVVPSRSSRRYCPSTTTPSLLSPPLRCYLSMVRSGAHVKLAQLKFSKGPLSQIKPTKNPHV
ncbi:uncharacterized protein LOC126654075 [Mercurialis annua]|uniref:uncharacterized protein LOC126654075 n=1 Tax=Mercurialis annua TaxID=3986 RepID=UPI0021606DEF|nr:uncharacterized protein LOC126654075 [Mercurialis annua]